MPVTIKINPDLAPESFNGIHAPTTAREALSQTSWANSQSMKMLLQTSLKDRELSDVVFTSNGFVYGCLEAYNNHHNLFIRPDDVWITIMAQFAIYADKNYQKMREHFVGGQEGTKDLTIEPNDPMGSVDFGGSAELIAALLEDRFLQDKELKNWIIPDFTTTTVTDKVTGAILLMASVDQYFSYEFQLSCGLPSVTLDGTKEDWEDLSRRLDKLLTFGDINEHPHLHAWYGLLKPIIKHFVDAFDVCNIEPAPPRAQEIVDFFQHICSIVGGGSGPQYISGWLAFFCAFSNMGNWQLHPIGTEDHMAGSGISPAESVILGKERGPVEWSPMINKDRIPPGYGEVNIQLQSNGAVFVTTMVAGTVGYRFAGDRRDTVVPITGWWYYLKKSQEELAETPRVCFY